LGGLVPAALRCAPRARWRPPRSCNSWTDHLQRPADEDDPDGELVWDLPPSIGAALVEGKFKDALGPLALNTIEHRLYVLSAIHTRRSLPNPTHEPVVRELVLAARRGYAARGVRPRKKTALTRDPLQRWSRRVPMACADCTIARWCR
jgi:hypothetical protein